MFKICIVHSASSYIINNLYYLDVEEYIRSIKSALICLALFYLRNLGLVRCGFQMVNHC